MRDGITKSGDSAEALVIKHVKSARDNEDKSATGKSKGDAIVECDGKDYYIEVKKKTWNQTRPVKYITHVGTVPGTNEFVVIPPDDLIAEALGRKGQHTKNPFVCVALGKVGEMHKWKQYRHSPDQLENAIHEAIRQGERSQTLKHAAKILQIRQLARVEDDKKLIREALRTK